MKSFLTFSLLFFCTVLYAQRDTSYLYTDKNLKPISKDSAEFILKSYQRDSSSWVLMISDKDNIPQLLETYSDSAMTIKHGSLIEYADGKMSMRGRYDNNKKSGNFIYYDNFGRISTVRLYSADILHGASVDYWPNGTKKYEVKYDNGNREQEYSYWENGVLSKKSYFDVLLKGWHTLEYHVNGQVIIDEVFNKTGEIVHGVYLDTLGNPVKKGWLYTPASFPGGTQRLYEIVQRVAKYPEDALQADTQGTIKLSFVITEKGTLEDVKVVGKGLYSSLNDEAIRAVKQAGKWNPAIRFGKPVKMGVTLPFKFGIEQGRAFPPEIKNSYRQ